MPNIDDGNAVVRREHEVGVIRYAAFILASCEQCTWHFKSEVAVDQEWRQMGTTIAALRHAATDGHTVMLSLSQYGRVAPVGPRS